MDTLTLSPPLAASLAAGHDAAALAASSTLRLQPGLVASQEITA